MLKKLTGKGKKKDSTPLQAEPVKKDSGPGSSSNQPPLGPPPPVLTISQFSSVPLPPNLQPWSDKFYR
ncbi:hypothetical protein A2U01_0070593, partial [Trifolium medium]|nr:hypothetical protein [Trifolium medium]